MQSTPTTSTHRKSNRFATGNGDPEDPPVSPEELTKFTRANLADYKIVRKIEYIEQLPTTATDKVQKYELREQE